MRTKLKLAIPILAVATLGSGAGLWSAEKGDEARGLQPPALSADYAKWRDLIVPNPTEQTYRKIAWRASVLHGIVDAQKQDRPVMLVLMNGHPLGCT